MVNVKKADNRFVSLSRIDWLNRKKHPDTNFFKEWTDKSNITRRGLTTNILTSLFVIKPRKTLVQIFIKIGPVNQKLPEGG